MNAADKLKELLSREAERVIAICCQLVQIPSEDPPGDTREIAAFIGGYLKGEGVDARIVSPHPEKPNVVAEVVGGRPGPTVVFNGHMDTFPVGDRARWSYDPFGGELADGRLYGRGSADMKGGLAACILSTVLLNGIRESLAGRVVLTCVSDEEVFGPWGTQYLLANVPEARGDALINGEPSSLDNVRVGEKGQYWFRFHMAADGGHAAYAALKPSAVRLMTAFLDRLSDLPAELSRVGEPTWRMMEEARASYDALLCPGATDAALSASMNVGRIEGGLSVNMVPEHCTAEVDFRLPPGASPDCLRAWIASVMRDFPACSMEEYLAHDAQLTEPDHPLAAIARATAEEVLGREIYTTFSLGGTEARLWRRLGVPAVTYGPNHHNMGSPDEYIVAEELIDVTKVQALTALRFLERTAAEMD